MDEFELLQELTRRSSRAGTLLMALSGKLGPSTTKPEKVQALRDLLVAQRSLLALVLENRSRLPLVGETEGYARPVINTLLMLADELDMLDGAEADALRAEAAPLTKRYLGPDGRLDMLRNLATSAYTRGDFARALDHMFAAAELADEGASPLKVARVALDRVDLLQLLGDVDRAEEGISWVEERHARGSLEQVGGSAPAQIEAMVEVARVRYDLAFQSGLFALARVRLDDARRHVQTAVDLSTRLGQPAELTQVQFVRIALADHRPDEALQWLDRVERVVLRMAPHKQGVLKLMRGHAYLLRGDLDSATQELRAGLHEARRHDDLEAEYKLHWRLAQALAQGEAAGEAGAEFLQACRCVDRLRRAPLGYRLDSCFLRDKYDVFEEALLFFAARGEAAMALEVMECVKSRRLAAALSAPRSAAVPKQDGLGQELLEVSRALDAIALGTGSGDVEALEHRRLDLLDALRRKDPRFRSLTHAEFDIDAMQTALRRLDATGLALCLVGARDSAPQHLLSVVVTPSTLHIDSRPFPATLRASLDAFVANLREDERNPAKYDFSEAFRVALDDLLSPRSIELALSRSKLLLAPHRRLHLLPWACLQHERTRVFEHVAVGILPCLSCVAPLATGTYGADVRTAFFGPPEYPEGSGTAPLHGLLAELERQRQRAAEAAVGVWLRGMDARVAELQRLLTESRAEADLLVVASHATFDPSEPMRSGLDLADGRLDAAWITHSRIGFGEVVLRACSTGDRVQSVGDLELVGDDTLGLPGAFLEAGVSSVVVSIPKLVASPETRRFFDRYLEARRGGSTPLLSLRSAQVAAWEEGDDPSSWCGVAVYGVS